METATSYEGDDVLCACVREWAGIFLLFLVARPGFGLGLRSTVCADLLSRCKVFLFIFFAPRCKNQLLSTMEKFTFFYHV